MTRFIKNSLTVVFRWRISFVLEKFALLQISNIRTKSERDRIVRIQFSVVLHGSMERRSVNHQDCTHHSRSQLMNKWPAAAENELFFDDSLLRRDSKGIKDTKGFDNLWVGRRVKGGSLFSGRSICASSHKWIFALLCRKPCGMLYFLSRPSSTCRDISVEP